MIPGTMNLNLYRGDTTRWQFTMWLDAEKTEPLDLTGVTAKAEIRDKPGGRKITPIECIVTLPNLVNASLNAANSALLPAKGAWDLQLTYSGGDVATLLAGKVTVIADITDSGAT